MSDTQDYIPNSGQREKQTYPHNLPESRRERTASTYEISIAFLSTQTKKNSTIKKPQKLGVVAGTHPQYQHSGG